MGERRSVLGRGATRMRMTKRDEGIDAHDGLRNVRAIVTSPTNSTHTREPGNSRMFLPRSLHPQRPSSSHPAPRPPLAPPPPPAAARDSAAEDPPSEDPAILCSLAFSDYEIWSNPTLRDPNHNGCTSSFFPSEPKH